MVDHARQAVLADYRERSQDLRRYRSVQAKTFVVGAGILLAGLGWTATAEKNAHTVALCTCSAANCALLILTFLKRVSWRTHHYLSEIESYLGSDGPGWRMSDRLSTLRSILETFVFMSLGFLVFFLGFDGRFVGAEAFIVGAPPLFSILAAKHLRATKDRLPAANPTMGEPSYEFILAEFEQRNQDCRRQFDGYVAIWISALSTVAGVSAAWTKGEVWPQILAPILVAIHAAGLSIVLVTTRPLKARLIHLEQRLESFCRTDKHELHMDASGQPYGVGFFWKVRRAYIAGEKGLGLGVQAWVSSLMVLGLALVFVVQIFPPDSIWSVIAPEDPLLFSGVYKTLFAVLAIVAVGLPARLILDRR